MAGLKATDPAEAFRLDLEYGQRFTSTGSLAGQPTPGGITDETRGLLPEPYHAAAREAVYAVYHYETPILWKTAGDVWQVPGHSYSRTTSKYRNKIIEALNLFGATVEFI